MQFIVAIDMSKKVINIFSEFTFTLAVIFIFSAFESFGIINACVV